MLDCLQLQVDGGLNQTLKSKTLAAPRLTAIDLPALSMRDGQNDLAKFPGDGFHQNGGPYQASEKQGTLLFRSNSFIPSSGATDFASAVRKMPSHDASIWRYERNGSPRANIGSSKSSQVLASSYNTVQGRGIHGDRLRTRESAHASPIWLETGETVGKYLRLLVLTFSSISTLIVGKCIMLVYCFDLFGLAANMYSEMREEARDHARLWNTYFEQVRSV